MKELWRDVVGYEGEYMISNKGRVMSLKDTDVPLILEIFYSEKGYPRINLMNNGKLRQVFIHRLVTESFIHPIEEGKLVNHKDGNKKNNSVDNLEIITQKENIYHSLYVLGHGIKPIYKLTKGDYKIIEEYRNIQEASKETGIDHASIWKVCNGKRNFTGGYSWAYKENYSEEYIKRKREKINKGLRMKKVYQIDPKTNNLVGEFKGVRLAERKLGISTIKHCVAGITKTAGGYKWSYEKPINEDIS